MLTNLPCLAIFVCTFLGHLVAFDLLCQECIQFYFHCFNLCFHTFFLPMYIFVCDSYFGSYMF